MNPIQKITLAAAKVSLAENNLQKEIEKAFPAGCTIKVWLGRGQIEAEVLNAVYGGRIRVCNLATRKIRKFNVLLNNPTRIGR